MKRRKTILEYSGPDPAQQLGRKWVRFELLEHLFPFVILTGVVLLALLFVYSVISILFGPIRVAG